MSRGAGTRLRTHSRVKAGRHSPDSEPERSLLHMVWGEPASKHIPGKARPQEPSSTHAMIGGGRDGVHWTCPQKLPSLAELPHQIQAFGGWG